ncbi:YdiK family protein [Niallia taxi]|uniref:YdiK family protein n=1 Tax=Niallia taxi TaxID=2499688 RepID=UPI003982722C
MRKSALLSAILYLILGALFTYFAVQSVRDHGGWGFFSYILVILATFDIGTGIRLISFHFMIKKATRKNQER